MNNSCTYLDQLYDPVSDDQSHRLQGRYAQVSSTILTTFHFIKLREGVNETNITFWTCQQIFYPGPLPRSRSPKNPDLAINFIIFCMHIMLRIWNVWFLIFVKINNLSISWSRLSLKGNLRFELIKRLWTNEWLSSENYPFLVTLVDGVCLLSSGLKFNEFY